MTTVSITIIRNGQEIEVDVPFSFHQPYRDQPQLSIGQCGIDQNGKAYRLDADEIEQAEAEAWQEAA